MVIDENYVTQIKILYTALTTLKHDYYASTWYSYYLNLNTKYMS